MEKALENMNTDDSNENETRAKLQTLTAEADAAAEAKKDLEGQYKAAMMPIKQQERTLANLKREMDAAKNRLKVAEKELQDTRNDILKKQGSAQSVESKRTEKLNLWERKLREAKDAKGAIAEEVEHFRKKYEELESPFETAKSGVEKIQRQIGGADKKLRDIAGSESNNLRLFGEKCPLMASKVCMFTGYTGIIFFI